MDQGKKPVPQRDRHNEVVLVALILCILVAIGTLSGCAATTPNPGVKVKSELEIAIEAVKDEWLRPCADLPDAPTVNSIGNLLEDASASLVIAAECAARHNSFVDYIAPVVNRQKKIPK